MILSIKRNDPYIQRMREPGHFAELDLDGPAWLFEAKRRYMAINAASCPGQDAMPYNDEEPTWAWHQNMLMELNNIKFIGNAMHCRVDTELVKGVHVLASNFKIRDLALGISMSVSPPPPGERWRGIRVTENGIYFLSDNYPTDLANPEAEFDAWVAAGNKYRKIYKNNAHTNAGLQNGGATYGKSD